MKHIQSINDFRRLKINENTNIGVKDYEYQTILNSYLETALWTEEEQMKEYSGSDKSYTIFDFNENERTTALNDIKKFIDEIGFDNFEYLKDNITLEIIGHDIWLSRNHHGAGFFDHSIDNDIEKIATKAAQNLESTNLLIGDDGELHFY